MLKRCLGFVVFTVSAVVALSAPITDPKSVLAKRSGQIEVTGLQKRVEVITDTWGVPHIYAQNSADLFFAQGWIAASDRLWQMEMWRRAGEGRLAEILGDRAIERDRFARLLRYRGDMDAEWKSYAPDAREIIESFVKGVNAYIAANADRLPIEFGMMGFRPEPWTPEVCITRLAGYVMTGNASTEVLRAQLVAAVGAERAAQLLPPDPSIPFEVAPGLDLKGIDNRVLAGSRAAGAAFVSRGGGAERDPGSNNWTLSGKRTTTGKPLLANDPHRTIALPSLRYMAHLVAPGWNVIGSGEPALPGIAVGHNDRIAFGFTIFPADMQDLYVEETDPSDPMRYKINGGGWEKMKVVTEQIRVKGRAEPVAADLLFTRHGPVIFEDRAAHRAYALRWIGAEPGTAGYLASLSLDRATDWKSFRAALERWKLPPENLVYADVDGNIGEQSAGLVPRRNNWRGVLPVPGGASYEWDGFFNIDDLPHSYNPPDGFIATANNRTIAADEKRTIGYEWSAPDRVNRITDVLRSKSKFSLEDMERLQHDEVSLPAREFVKILPAFAPEMLRKWDGNLSRDSAAAALYEVTLRKLRPKVTRTIAPASVSNLISARLSMPVILNALAKMPEGERRSILTQSLDEAQKELSERLGPDPHSWAWGDLHKTPFEHPLSAEFDLPAPRRGGDSTTPNATSPDAQYRQTSGASYREVLDLGDWDRSRAINVPGQSGQPGSPHYGDLLSLWSEGKYFPLVYSRAAVEKAAGETLMLLPK